MSGKVEYKIGEIFRFYGETFQCVADFVNNVKCSICALSTKSYSCYSHKCHGYDRSDNTSVHYVKVTEPKAGMLFRASDGQMYKLKRYIQGETGCVCQLPAEYTTLSCEDIFLQSFGVYASPGLRWCLVEESKEKQEEKPKMKKEDQPKRHIELAVVKVEGDQVTFRIAEQTHREENLTPNGREFKSCCGYFLVSQECPEYKECRDLLYVRGFDNYKDDNPVTVPLITFAKIMRAVTEYNETNGEGYEKPWPQDGDKYYVIGSDAVIFEWHYTHSCADEARRDLGNFFRTRDEAEAALERVRKALKGE